MWSQFVIDYPQKSFENYRNQALEFRGVIINSPVI
jgi:hypothetical protein